MRRIRGPLAVCLLLSGCSILGPVPSPDRYFTLTAARNIDASGGDTATAGRAPTAATVYGLGPIKLPAYLNRNEIAIRVSPTEVRYSGVDRWAEPLPDNVASVLVQDLSTGLGTNRIVVFPWPHEANVTYQIEITFTRFEVDSAGENLLSARWAIKDTATARYLMLRDTVLTRPGAPGDTAAAMAGLSALLGNLSEDIATALRALPPPAEAAEAPRKPPAR